MSEYIDGLLWQLYGEWPGDGGSRDRCALCDDTPDVEGYVPAAGPVHDRHDLADIILHAMEPRAIPGGEAWLIADTLVALVKPWPTWVDVVAPAWTTCDGVQRVARVSERDWVPALLRMWGYSEAVAA